MGNTTEYTEPNTILLHSYCQPLVAERCASIIPTSARFWRRSALAWHVSLGCHILRWLFPYLKRLGLSIITRLSQLVIYPSIRWLLGSCALFAPCHPFIRRSCPSDGTLACGFLVGCISFLSCTGMYAVEYIWATFRRTGAFLWQVPIHSKAALLTPHYGSELHWCSIYQSISRSQGRSLQPIEIRCVEHSYCCRYLYVPHPIQCIVNSDL